MKPVARIWRTLAPLALVVTMALCAWTARAQMGAPVGREQVVRAVEQARRMVQVRPVADEARLSVRPVPFRLLGQPGSIAGTIKGAELQDLPFLTVVAWSPDSVRLDSSYFITGTLDGTYRFDGLPAAAYYVTVIAPGYEPLFYPNARTLDEARPVQVTDGAEVTGIDFDLQQIRPGTGSISGRVVAEASDQPIAGAAIHVFSMENPFEYGYAETGPDGRYVVERLTSGSYLVQVWAEGYLFEVYDDADDYALATPVPVVEPGQTKDIDFALSGGGTVTGTVRNEEGTPIAGAFVQVWPESWPDSSLENARNVQNFGGWAMSAEDGSYTITGLSTGTYLAVATVSVRWQFVSEWYREAASPEEALPFAVAEGQVVPDIDFTLAAPVGSGRIAGHVYDEQGQALAGAWVMVAVWSGAATDTAIFGHPVDYAVTDADGAYQFEALPAGTYMVTAMAKGAWSMAQQWWEEADTFEEADPLVITGSDVYDRVDFHLAVDAGTGAIAGSVRDTKGNPLAGASIFVSPMGEGDAWRHDGAWGYATSDSAGTYRVDGLPEGTYQVQSSFWHDDHYGVQWFDHAATPEAATPIELAEGEERGDVSFDLDVRPLYGSVEGTITQERGGLPVERALVEVTPMNRDPVTDAPFRGLARYAVTDAQGRYRIDVLPEGTYVLVAYADNALEYYDDVTEPGRARPFPIAGGQVTTIDVGLSSRGAAGGAITGRVTVESGGGVDTLYTMQMAGRSGGAPEMAVVMARPMESKTQVPLSGEVYSTVTAPDGSYTLTGLPDGYYVLMVRAPWLVSVFYDRVYDPEQATPVKVEGQNTVKGINFTLSPMYTLWPGDDDAGARGVVVYGYVFDEQGAPVTGAMVYLVDEQERRVASAQTGADGRYELNGISPGRYRVHAGSAGYETRFNGGAENYEDAALIDAAGGRLEVDLTLPAATAIGAEQPPEVPETLVLEGNYPNPFNPSTRIAFRLGHAGPVRVTVYDALGARVALVADRVFDAGRQTLVWDGSTLSGNGAPSGLYFYRVQAGSEIRVGRMMLVR